MFHDAGETRLQIPLAALSHAAATLPPAEFERVRTSLAALGDEIRSPRHHDPAARRRLLACIDGIVDSDALSQSDDTRPARGSGDEQAARARAAERLPRFPSQQDGRWASLDATTRAALASPPAVTLLEYCFYLPSAKPSAKWIRHGRALLDAVPGGDVLLWAMLKALSRYNEASGIWLDESTAEIARGIVALATELRADGAAALVGDVAVAAWASDRDWGNQHALWPTSRSRPSPG